MRSLALLGFLILTGCTDLMAPMPGIAGTYDLATISHAKLPQALSSDGNEVYQLLGATLTLNADSTFRDSTLTQTVTILPLPGTTTRQAFVFGGRYSAHDSTVTFTPDPPHFGYGMARTGNGLTRTVVRTGINAQLLDYTMEYVRH